MKSAMSIFDWLTSVRSEPYMYASNLHDLETLIYGYYNALGMHNIAEPGPQMMDKFNIWAASRTGWPGFNRGWGYAFDENTPADAEPFPFFFGFVDQFRALSPTVTARVTLQPDHRPTGKRCVIGFSGRMKRPDEILVVNYAPTSLNHLRHRYDDRFVDDWFLMLGNGSHETKLTDMFDWVHDEFGVSHSDWEISSGEMV